MALGGGGTGAPPSARRLKCGTGGTGAPPSATSLSLGGGGGGAPPSARRLNCGTGGTGAPPSATSLSLGGGGTGAPPSDCNLFWRSFDVKTVAEATTSDTDTSRVKHHVLWIVILILLKFWSVAVRPDSELRTMTRLPISDGVVAANKSGRVFRNTSDLRIISTPTTTRRFSEWSPSWRYANN